MHLYGKTGGHIFSGEDATAGSDLDYSFNLTGNNFTDRGFYQAKFQGNDTAFGGASEIECGVNDYGEELSEATASSHNYSMIFLMALFILSLVGLFAFENPAGKLALYWFAHIIFVVGSFSVWQFNQGYALSYMVTAGVFKVLFYVSIIAMFPMILLSLAWIFYIHTMNDDIKKMMNRGMDEGEAIDRARRKRRW
jgi:hypothetical protein